MQKKTKKDKSFFVERGLISAHVKNGTFNLHYCLTDDNIADTFTKPMPRPHLQKLRTMMGLGHARGGVLESED